MSREPAPGEWTIRHAGPMWLVENGDRTLTLWNEHTAIEWQGILNALERRAARYEAALRRILDRHTMPWLLYCEKYGLNPAVGEVMHTTIAIARRALEETP